MMIKKQFSDVADGGNGGDNRAARARKAGTRVVSYADIDTVFADSPEAGQELKAKMESLMESIDRDPTSFDSIIKFGTEPIEALGKISRDILKAQGQLGEQVKVMNIAMDNMDQGFKGLGVEELVGGLKNLASGAAKAGVAGAKGLGKFMKKVGNAMSGADKKRTEEERHVQAMIDKLPDAYFEMQKLSQALKDTESGIKNVIKEAERLGVARVTMVREMNVYLGAAPEVLRRYDEVYIKEAKAAYDESSSPEDELYLSNVITGKENFQGQYNVLEASAAQGIVAAQQLRMLIDELHKQRKIIQQFSTIRENEWMALLSGAGLSASSLKIAQIIKKSDETGDRLHEMTTEMQEKAHEMTLNSQSRGTVDPAKLIESLNRMKTMIEKENETKEKRALEAEATRQQIRAATEKLIESVEAAKNQRILESAPEKNDKAADAPAANDNATEVPDVSASPQKKSGGSSHGPN